VSFIGGMEGT